MRNRLRWGILGTGGIAKKFTSDLVATGFQITAVGSRTPAGAASFAAAYGIERTHGSYEELVSDPDVDVIYVSTPHPFHAPNALLALDAGKHVLVEKPFAMSATEATQILDRAQQNGLVALEAMWTRWLPHMVRLRDVLAAGTLGDLRSIVVDHTQHMPQDPSHRAVAPELGGGALLDLGIYPISFAWQVFGAPTSIMATSTPTATGVDASTSVILGYDEGRVAVTHCGLDGQGPNRAAIIGSAARLEIDPIWYKASSFTVLSPEHMVIERFEHPLTTRGMEFQAFELERLVATGESVSPELSPAETIGIMGTLDEIRRQIGLTYPGE
jgi:predicted dehydrogenase